MKSIIDPFREELIKYCGENKLDYDKIVQLPRCGNDSVLFFQRRSEKNDNKGLRDNIPAEVILKIEKQKDKFVFEQGENISLVSIVERCTISGGSFNLQF